MKKVLIFIAGVVIGAILMLVIAALIGNSSNGESSNNGMTFFEKEGDCISENNFEVFQVLIKVSEGKCAKQIGTFKYSTKAGFDKTVPIVSILNK